MIWWIAAVCAYFVKGLCGFANTLVFSTILSFAANNVSISPVELLLGYPTNIVIALKERKSIRWRMALPLTALVLAGNVPGMLLLKNADSGMVKALFGVVIVFVGLEMLFRQGGKSGGRQSRAVLWAIGVLSGILCGLYGIGALLGAYVGRVTEDSKAFRANMCVVFTAENTFRVIMYTLLGVITPDIFIRAVGLLPFAALGLALGFAACGRLEERLIRCLVVVMLIVSGFVLVVQNL